MKVIINNNYKGELLPDENGLISIPVEWFTDTSKCGETTVSVEVGVSDKEE